MSVSLVLVNAHLAVFSAGFLLALIWMCLAWRKATRVLQNWPVRQALSIPIGEKIATRGDLYNALPKYYLDRSPSETDRQVVAVSVVVHLTLLGWLRR